MNVVYALVATFAGCAGGWLIYLASPQQRWRASAAMPSCHRWWPAIACVLVSLLAMWRVLAPMEAVFAWSILLMLVWSLAPFLGAWRAQSRAAGGGKGGRA